MWVKDSTRHDNNAVVIVFFSELFGGKNATPVVSNLKIQTSGSKLAFFYLKNTVTSKFIGII